MTDDILQVLAQDLDMRLPKPWQALHYADASTLPVISILEVGRTRRGQTILSLNGHKLQLSYPKPMSPIGLKEIIDYDINDPESLNELDDRLRELGVPLAPADTYLYSQI